MISRPPPPRRPETREVVELRRLLVNHPELATAVDLQIALLELQRRLQGRVPLPWIEIDPAWVTQQQTLGRKLLKFEDIPINWTDFRLIFRQTAELLRRFEALEESDYERIQSLIRDGQGLLPPLVRAWYHGPSLEPGQGDQDTSQPAADVVAGVALTDGIQQVLALAMRPFLARCAESFLARTDVSGWMRGLCPLCGGEPELAYINPASERLLICSRCTGRWPFDPIACPFCGNEDSTRISSYTSPDTMYRLFGCDRCLRYLKAYDGRRSARSVMLAVDSIATLPLDAAAIQNGYRG